MLKILLILALISCNNMTQASVFNKLFSSKKIKNEFDYYQVETKKAPLKIFIINSANLYSKPEDQIYNPFQNSFPRNLEFSAEQGNPFWQSYSKQAQKIILQKSIFAANQNSKHIYKYTQLLLQEALREIIMSLKKDKSIDMVIFAGNQVYSNNQYDSFIAIANELNKFAINYYELIGPNDLRGYKDPERIFNDKYFLLKTKDTNIVFLNNVDDKILPKKFPEETTEQFLWLQNILSDITEQRFSDLIILSYFSLSKEEENYIKAKASPSKIIFLSSSKEEFNAKLQEKNHQSIDLPSLSSYPCSYLEFTRNSSGVYKFEIKEVGLKDIQEIAKEQLSK